MSEIQVEENPSEERLRQLGVRDWPIWTKEVSEFPWYYEEEETCYILEGDVLVTPKDEGEPVRIGVGDLVVFPQGMSCHWEIRKAVRKHYKFG
ncbi:cupin domain-containing protein [Candidatus Sumerlaeota bacterium]|nr:cupin domain-containing protein [Candidatus Sumerlaeota bacterium]